VGYEPLTLILILIFAFKLNFFHAKIPDSEWSSLCYSLGLQERLLERRRRERVRVHREGKDHAEVATSGLRERHHRQLRAHLQAR